ncbi:hypothetical protein E3N88_20074 [Mikania micrantha]|uniref:Uncharacterized protein n=1 Tax=Mikania micrantha TaxID=192012 RepID=A0A5N6NFZ3_9ASTR|nr:hypothetical protein E3N88_43827 [Mikania micrantha]KAD4888001.1 hypothetical protein E3N88_20074 [Mikania micrantha]
MAAIQTANTSRIVSSSSTTIPKAPELESDGASKTPPSSLLPPVAVKSSDEQETTTDGGGGGAWMTVVCDGNDNGHKPNCFGSF